MSQRSGMLKPPAEKIIKDIRRATRRQYGVEEKICIVLKGLRGEESIAALCRREGIAESLITAGRRSSWKQAGNGLPATQHAPQSIAIALDIQEIRTEPLDNLEGALITTPERGVGSILVKWNSSRQRRRFTMAHELGHF